MIAWQHLFPLATLFGIGYKARSPSLPNHEAAHERGWSSVPNVYSSTLRTLVLSLLQNAQTGDKPESCNTAPITYLEKEYLESHLTPQNSVACTLFHGDQSNASWLGTFLQRSGARCGSFRLRGRALGGKIHIGPKLNNCSDTSSILTFY